MVTSPEFNGLRPFRPSKGTAVKEVIRDSKFWNDCLVIVKIVMPLLRLLPIVDSDEKLALGYVYEGMHRAKKTIKKIFKNKKILYKP